MNLPKEKMKLPTSGEQFVFTKKDSYLYGSVVSGVYVEIRADDRKPDFLWYYVYVDKACCRDGVIVYKGIPGLLL